LFQEYDFKVIVKPGRLSAGPDRLSRIETGKESNRLEEGLSYVQLFSMYITNDHFDDIIHFSTIGTTYKGYYTREKKELVVCLAYFLVIQVSCLRWEHMKYCEGVFHILNTLVSSSKNMEEQQEDTK